MTYEIIEGDCLEFMRGMAGASVDLIVTSPPYAQQRKATYGGTPADQYVEWFLPIAGEIKRLLKPTGSFVLNIKEHCESGERHTYVLDLIHALRRQGWLWTEEYIWHKRTVVPGRWPNRLKDAWERCLHFTQCRQFAMYQDAVKIPSCETEDRRERRRAPGKRHASRTGSGFTHSDLYGNPAMVLPSNVLNLASTQIAGGHPAAFPIALPDWFIRLFTQQGDTVLDPFCGSGSTGVGCINTGRNFIGIERDANYCTIARHRIAAAESTRQPALFAAD